MLFKRYVEGYAFMYNSDNGLVYRKMKGTGKWRLTGRKQDAWGYFNIIFKKEQILLHRFIFVIVTGDWPKGQVDHINGNKEDNSWSNLRDTDAKINAMNAKLPINNTSGYKGICYHSRDKEWLVRVANNYIGTFKTLKEAVKARDAYILESKLNIPNYGS